MEHQTVTKTVQAKKADSRSVARQPKRESSAVAHLMLLQRSVGNRALGRFLQAKLSAGAPVRTGFPQRKYACGKHTIDGEKCAAREPKRLESSTAGRTRVHLHVNQQDQVYESEAERAASQVVSGSKQRVAWSLSDLSDRGRVQRECSCGGTCEEWQHEKLLQRHASESAAPVTAPASVHNLLSGPGAQLEASTRRFVESRFGYDFRNVRIFNDHAAADSAQAVSANAYTVGNRIVFNHGKYAPESPTGLRLLAHELAHVVQQSRGGREPDLAGEPDLEHEAGHVADQVQNRKGLVAPVYGRSGIGIARDAAPGQQLIEVKFPDGVKQLTPDEFANYKRRALSRLRIDLNLTIGHADNGRQSQQSMLAEYQGGVESLWDVVKKPKALIGIAADIKAGVTPPYIGAWSNAKNAAQRGLAACDREDLREAASDLRMADSMYRDAMQNWNAYRLATIGGAEAVASNLETVRDVSFAIALAAGAAVAAPAIAAVAGAGALGTATTALGTAAATGAGGVVLGGGSTALASYASTGKIDVKAVKKDALKFGKEGVVTGLTAGLGGSLNVAAKGAKLAQPLVQTAAKRCLTEAGVNVTGEVTSELLDKVTAPEGEHQEQEGGPKPLLPGRARAALTGCLSGVLGVPVAKLGRTGTKATELATTAGVGYLDARMQGQSNEEALLAAGQSALTSAAIARGHKGSERAKARKATPQEGGSAPTLVVPREPETAGKKPEPLKAAHEPAEQKLADQPPGTPAPPHDKPAAQKVIEQQKANTGHEGPPAGTERRSKGKSICRGWPRGDRNRARPWQVQPVSVSSHPRGVCKGTQGASVGQQAIRRDPGHAQDQPG